MPRYPVFDIHTHPYPPALAARAVGNLEAFYGFRAEGDGTYEDLAAHAAAAGVRGFLFFSVATTPHQVPKINDTIAALVARSQKEDGFLAAGFAAMHPDFPDMEKELDRALSLGLRGVKMHPDLQKVAIDDPRMRRLCALLSERGMPLYLHMGDSRPEYRYSEAARLCRVKKEFPGLTVVAAHLGGYYAWEGAECLAGIPGLWFDTSSTLWALPPERAAALIRRFGTDRVMFGTDYPVKEPAGEIARFLALPGFSEPEKRAVLYDNALRFLGLSPEKAQEKA
ncbi:MAG: amidohydrolase family protein [Eubacteriales bacterium]|nr:amidohydrolase family protein [Eubacteriales bacterium]